MKKYQIDILLYIPHLYMKLLDSSPKLGNSIILSIMQGTILISIFSSAGPQLMKLSYQPIFAFFYFFYYQFFINIPIFWLLYYFYFIIYV